MSEALLQWCVDQLHHKFGLEACEDIVQYVLSIENAEEIKDYMGDLLQGTDGRKGLFIDEFVSRWMKTQRQTTDSSSLFHLKEPLSSPDSQDMSKDSLKKSKRKGRNKQEVMAVSQSEPEPEAVKTPIDLMRAQENTSSSSTKKKSKFVNLYAKEGQDKMSILFPVDMLVSASPKSTILSITASAVVASYVTKRALDPASSVEAWYVCTREEQEILQRDSNKSQKLRKKLMGDGGERDYLPNQEAKMKAGLEKAVQHKDKLLDYDKTGNLLIKLTYLCIVPLNSSVKRTQVLDDESDYFATESNQWLSPNEREKLRKKEEELRDLRHASRKDRKITLDFAGRKVLDEGNNLNDYYDKLDETLRAMNSDSPSKSPMFSRQVGRQTLGDLVNPNIMQAAPEWVDVGGSESYKKNTKQGKSSADEKGGEDRQKLRLQDKDLQEMADGGWCLSMHQPWATLLVRGIKRVEGRTWYSSHRGRLWIAAAAKQPSPQEIAEVEAMYRHIYKKDPRFPKDYPTGCLLGCVNMTDCLSQEQFREQFPNTCEESASPFVFICTNAQEMLVKFPMKGKHKIWKLESQYHQGAKKGLVPSATD
ncbi:hypothetical protein NQZ68_034984 [Dissostichus eleginoides]|nr:hypothetical protein NQZ68_034984 [Dissostichus eleginoides]